MLSSQSLSSSSIYFHYCHYSYYHYYCYQSHFLNINIAFIFVIVLIIIVILLLLFLSLLLALLLYYSFSYQYYYHCNSNNYHYYYYHHNINIINFKGNQFFHHFSWGFHEGWGLNLWPMLSELIVIYDYPDLVQNCKTLIVFPTCFQNLLESISVNAFLSSSDS